MATSLVNKLATILAPNPTAFPSATAKPSTSQPIFTGDEDQAEKQVQIRALELKRMKRDGKVHDKFVSENSDDYSVATTSVSRPASDEKKDLEVTCADCVAC